MTNDCIYINDKFKIMSFELALTNRFFSNFNNYLETTYLFY
jgi:hypothetical protein